MSFHPSYHTGTGIQKQNIEPTIQTLTYGLMYVIHSHIMVFIGLTHHQRIAAYTSANWRSKIQLYKPPTLRLTISDYFYNYQFKEVLEKARQIATRELGPDAALTSKLTTEYRHHAVREILADYTPEQKAEAERARRAVTEQGYSPELQARNMGKRD
ncbi:hypothetical protein BJ165DRAFT_1410149 [Panaeolus papilionaceus]|nr:hypothetical protein BJ165DRAFT_1410149 [Panaeolus papilionaceus]